MSKFIEGGDIRVYVQPKSINSEKILIGLVQSHGTSDSRSLPQVGELGSDKTFTLIGDSQKSGSLTRLMVKGNSVLKALYAPSIQEEETSEAIVAADEIVIYASKRESEDLFNSEPIGLVQQYGVSSNLPVVQIGEIGSSKKYLLTGKAAKSINFSKMMSEDESVLRAFYKCVSNGNPIPGNNWTNLEDDLFKTPIDIGLSIGDVKIKLEGAIPGSISGVSQQGSRGIADSITFAWDKTVYVDPEGIERSPIWLDLDNAKCREPFTLILEYTRDDGTVLSTKKHKGCIVASISHSVSHGTRATAESIHYILDE